VVVEEIKIGDMEILMLVIHQVVVMVGEGDLMRDKDQEDQEGGAHNNQTIRQMEEALEDREVVEVDDIAGGRDNRAIT